jgi:lipoprotein signal peptidase
VFNLADVAVTVGAGLLLLTLLRPDGKFTREDS